jgi:serine/threonine protein kinase
MSDAVPMAVFRDALPLGTVIHGYTIRAVLGRGGFGTTYHATDQLDQPFAIKEYFPRRFAVRRGLEVIAGSREFGLNPPVKTISRVQPRAGVHSNAGADAAGNRARADPAPDDARQDAGEFDRDQGRGVAAASGSGKGGTGGASGGQRQERQARQIACEDAQSRAVARVAASVARHRTGRGHCLLKVIDILTARAR